MAGEKTTYGESATHVFRRESYAVNENYQDVKDSGGIDAIAERALRAFQRAHAEGFKWFAFYAQLVRFIPDNPNYTGELARKAGKWAPDLISLRAPNITWISGAQSVSRTRNAVYEAVHRAFEYSSQSNSYAGSIDDASSARTFWLLFYTFEFFTRKPEPRVPVLEQYEDGDDVDELPLVPLVGAPDDRRDRTKWGTKKPRKRRKRR